MTEEALLKFVGDSFRSAWPLELLLLFLQDPQRTWHLAELVRESRASAAAVGEGLVELRQAGLAASDPLGGFRFHAASPDREMLARELTDLYSRKPRTIMRAILQAPNDRIQTFADAFRIRKDPE